MYLIVHQTQVNANSKPLKTRYGVVVVDGLCEYMSKDNAINMCKRLLAERKYEALFVVEVLGTVVFESPPIVFNELKNTHPYPMDE